MDHIQILFKEYDSLRAEIIARTNVGYQLLGLGAGALAWLLSRPINQVFVFSLVIIGIAMIIFVGVWWRDTYMCSCRIKEIEKEINTLAGAALLKWETGWTGGPFSWITRRPGQRS